MEFNLLGLVLQVSRLLGIAPYVRGSQYHVSRAIDICGKTVLAFTCTLTVIVLTYIVFMESSLLTVDAIYFVSRLWVLLIILIGTYTAAGRMTRANHILKQLEKIDLNVTRRRNTSGNRKMISIMLIYIATTTITRIQYVVQRVFIDHHNFVFPLIVALEYQIVVFLEMQIISLAARVLLTLETINDNLEDLIPGKYQISTQDAKPTAPRVAWENIGDFRMNTMKFNRKSQSGTDVRKETNIESSHANDALKIRQLAKHYFEICEIVRTITKWDGFLMILIILHHMLNLEFSSYKIIIGITRFKSATSVMLPLVILCVTHTTGLILCTESFHQTHAQMDRTHLAINYLKCRRGDEDEVSNELEMFLRVILLNKTTYSLLSLCTLGRPLVAKIFGSLVTYLVIILTYGSEVTHTTISLNNEDVFDT